MISKKAATTSVIVVLILMLVGSSVLYGVTSQILNIFGADADEQICTLTTVFSAATKIQGVENLKIDCPLRLRTITSDEVRRATVDVVKSANQLIGKDEVNREKFDNLNKKFLREVEGDTRYDKLSKGKGLDILLESTARTDPFTEELALSSLVGDEMRKCWKKMGQGDLDLFSNWFSDETLWNQLLSLSGFKEKPAICVICSRVKFDKAIRDDTDLNSGAIRSLQYWAQTKKIKSKPVTYYEYLMDEAHDKELFNPKWIYSVNEPQAVVFARIPASQIGEWGKHLDTVWQSGLNIATKLTLGYDTYKPKANEDAAKDLLYLFPYEKVNQVCGHIANEAPNDVN
jgi:hypothetical protein